MVQKIRNWKFDVQKLTYRNSHGDYIVDQIIFCHFLQKQDTFCKGDCGRNFYLVFYKHNMDLDRKVHVHMEINVHRSCIFI